MKTLTISRSVLVLAGVIVFSLALLVLVQCQRAASGATPEPGTPEVTLIPTSDLGSRLAAGPEEMTMHDGVPAVKGLATHEGTGESGEFIVVRTESGKEFRFVVPPGTNIFRSSDVAATVNSPIPGATPVPVPTVENPISVLRGMKDTLVLVRYDPANDPPKVRSILIIEVTK